MAEGSDPDEFEAYDDFSGLTEDDFARLDADILNHLNAGETVPPSADSGFPLISIEIENTEEPGPLRQYRHNGTLSVTDLVSLAWCEVQVDYGLRQKRSRKLADRPRSFRGSSGKEIVVRQDVAVKNDKTTKRGQSIHKKLELALVPPGETIEIRATRKEEVWALRLLDLLSSLDSLMAQKCAREISVFGFVQDVLVFGIIDELALQCPQPETGEKRASDSPLPSPKRAFRGSSPADEVPPVPRQTIRVIDTKTRRTESVPSDEDAESARLQLMIYRRFLTVILETSTPFNYAALFLYLDLDPLAPFSDVFQVQMEELLLDASPPACLNEVVDLLRRGITELRLPPVDETVQVIYRSQNKLVPRAKGKGREPPRTREDDELARAIQMSLEKEFDVDLADALRMSLLDVGVEAQLEPGAASPKPLSTNLAESEPASPSKVGRQATLVFDDNGRPVASSAVEAKIIGTKEFPHDDAMLDAFLDSALQWWRGERKARGVGLRQTHRCYSCEYIDDCEWREQKAEEFLNKKAVL